VTCDSGFNVLFRSFLPMASTSTNTTPPVIHSNAGNAIIINPCQRLNPLLDCIKNVNKEFGDIVPDFQVGRTTGVLYLSLKYHRLHPEYIYQRIEKLGNMFTLRVLLLICDISEHQDSIKEITKLEEAGFYLSTFKSFEHKPPDLIKERVDKEFSAMYRTSLTSVSKVNKTDVETLKMNFGVRRSTLSTLIYLMLVLVVVGGDCKSVIG